MSNQTNGVWEGLYWENNTIVVGNSGWLVILTLIVMRLTLKILRHPTIMFKEEPKPIQDLVVQCFNQDKIKKNVRIEPIKRKVEETKKENSGEKRHSWDIAQEIITEQNRASLAVKWSAIPLEVLFDEQFMSIIHAIEELMDVSPLQNAVTQLPKDIYKIVKQYEHIPKVSAKSIDDLIYNISKTYFYFVIESLCRLTKSIQQGQRTSFGVYG